MQRFDHISQSVARITMTRTFPDQTSTGAATASAFFWRVQGQDFLITNWHNVTGQDPRTGQNMGSFAPNMLNAQFSYRGPTNVTGGHPVFTGFRNISLRDDDEEPLWLEHPLGSAIDVVAIPISFELPEGGRLCYLNLSDFAHDWQPDIGDDCHIVGHPEGISGPGGSAIWKRASIASAPLLDFDDEPLFLVDTVGNRGLSGSPVIGRASGIHVPGGGAALSPDSIVGSWKNFIGVYSGRMADQGIGSQLGRVWKKTAIEEILATLQ